MTPTAPSNRNNTAGVLAVSFGIAAIPLFFCKPLGVLIGLVAVVLGLVGRWHARQGTATNRGQALTGLVLGAVAVAGIVVDVAVRLGNLP